MNEAMVTVADRLLHWLRPPADVAASPYVPRGGQTTSMLARHFGAPLWAACAGKTVLDFGCGDGPDAIALAQHGARHVVGVDLHGGLLERARARAQAAGVADRCTFTTETDVVADLVVSSDTFEHVADLPAVLCQLRRHVTPRGEVWAAFGPPWYHPKGGHMLSVFPWAHLLVSEAALCRWRSASAGRPVRSFAEASLGCLSVAGFRRAVARSPFTLTHLRLLPLRVLTGWGLERVPGLRELVTSVVTCRLVPR